MSNDKSGMEAGSAIEALRAEVRAQSEVIAALEARLSQVEAPPASPAPVAPAGPPLEPTANRRELLAKAAAATVGAVAAGTAVAIGQATPAAAAQGVFDGSPAVVGTANPTNSIGVRGTSLGGMGVEGMSTDSWGVHAVSTNGHALVIEAPTGRHIRLFGSGVAPPARNTFNNAGVVVFDSDEDLWLCVGTGAPGTWRRLGGVDTAGALTVLSTPKRVYDSRAGYPPAVGTKSPLVGGVARACDLKANSSGVPAGATAVMLNLVATGTTGAGGGFLAVYRSGVAWPGTSNVNWSGPNQNIAATTITGVDANASCNLYANVATDVVVDVIGYYL